MLFVHNMDCLVWKSRFQTAYALYIFFILSFSITQGVNILVVPIDGSHWVNMRILIEELTPRGHNITVLYASPSLYIKEKPDLNKYIVVEMQRNASENTSAEVIQNFVKNALEALQNGYDSYAFLNEIMSFLWNCHIWTREFIVAIFENKHLLRQLETAHFDLVLTDPAFPTGSIVAYYLKLPVVYNVRWVTTGEAHFLTAPSPLSYVPTHGLKLSDKMNFLQRTQNVCQNLVQSLIANIVFQALYNDLCYHYLGPDTDIETVLLRADVWLMRVDFIFEFPRPTMPNIVYIGGFQCKPSKPLPLEFEEFVQSSGDHGIIVMSLGTIVSSLPMHITMQIAEAFAQVPQKVIWRYDGNIPPNIGNNTLLAKWIPQNDLLGHPKTRAFIAHGGTNGVYEAIYHGVPVVGMPLLFDQFDNLLRLEIRGAAKVINVATMRSTDLLQALNEVIHNTSYRENMQKLSALHRDQPETPMERAIFWIEYVARHKGAAHLRSESYQLPWYIYYCVDVMIFLLSLFLIVIALTVLLLKKLCNISWIKKQKIH
ncbi:UDP-glucuronosyltransferase 2A1-like [Stegostoma tigrinum]|uniref:UDP-glucuronosyltransferase 2A1-like n=1 Tax=Stegostoma tigrinum TaxID=3053191 RepID=UPI00202B2A08|nr:UDP-glucuronosyltransferase 2A1-like [Stegostoma tigrinum]XP_048418941.1 UDP-glucuronosyltransferase 2A1-like [Stegostoma tigrinum]